MVVPGCEMARCCGDWIFAMSVTLGLVWYELYLSVKLRSWSNQSVHETFRVTCCIVRCFETIDA